MEKEQLCSTCKHCIVTYSLSGHHFSECGIDYRIGLREKRECVYHVPNMSGLYANERKHDFFTKEEFLI